jgi:phosphatidylserine/phosphatidylglycerophosphate/cardiolipin synthase-like enzyme
MHRSGFLFLLLTAPLYSACETDSPGTEWIDSTGISPWKGYDVSEDSGPLAEDGGAGQDNGGTMDSGPDEERELPRPALRECLSKLGGQAVTTFFSKNCAAPELCPCSPADVGELVAYYLEQTQDTADVCVMELQDFSVSDALLGLLADKLAVRLVVDDEYDESAEEKAIEQLVGGGLSPVSDAPSTYIMHSKFVVIDGETVIVTSANFTTHCSLSNANNGIVFRSKALADIFTGRFNEMWNSKLFHEVNAPGPHVVTVEASTVEVYFGPDWASINRLTKAIKEAKSAIHFSIFAFTLEEVKEALLDRCGEVEIRGVFDPSQEGDKDSMAPTGWCPEAEVLVADVPVSPGVDPDFGYRKLHHKVMIIDPQSPATRLVITGSTNWSYSAAEKNDEVMLTTNHPAVVAAYESEFQARFAEASE